MVNADRQYIEYDLLDSYVLLIGIRLLLYRFYILNNPSKEQYFISYIKAQEIIFISG